MATTPLSSTVSTVIGSGNNSIHTGSSVIGFGDITADNITLNGVNLTESLAAINKRLSILVPDQSKLEKYKALQEAYSQYQMLEAMCYAEENK